MKRLQLLILVLAAVTAVHASAHADDAHPEPAVPFNAEQFEWGMAADPAAVAVTRTIDIRMLDAMRFSPDVIDVRRGETVRLVLTNSGRLAHELVLGTRKVLDDHAALMMRFPDMEHPERYMTHVAPGKIGEIIWTFNRAGEFDFACLIAGHYQAGMAGRIRVADTVGGTILMPVADTSVPPTGMAPEGIAMTDGEIRKVDKEAGKITIRHGEIRNLDMPAMTMVFRVKDPAMLDQVKPGDRVRFHAEDVAGVLVVTALVPPT